MGNNNQCDMCGHYLEPDEALLCDRCRQGYKGRVHRAHEFRLAIEENIREQIEEKFQEVGQW